MNFDTLIAKADTMINASVDTVWEALTNPDKIKLYMFGSTVTSNWTKGSAITWEGEWQGKRYQDKGKILEITPNKKLQYSHFSPLSGTEDKPENYHTVTIELQPKGNQTSVHLTQDKNESEEDRQHSQKNWEMMLTSLKKLVEKEHAVDAHR